MNINLASLTQFKYGRLNAVDLNNKRYRMYDCPLSYLISPQSYICCFWISTSYLWEHVNKVHLLKYNSQVQVLYSSISFLYVST